MKIFIIALLISTAMLYAAEVPDWWYTRGIINTNFSPSDYSSANIGQLKNVAYQTWKEIEARLSAITETSMSLMYDYEGQAQIDILRGEHYIGSDVITVLVNQIGIPPDEGTAPWCTLYYDSALAALTRMTVGSQVAPEGADMIFEVVKNGTGTGVTVTLGAGVLSNSQTINIGL